MHGWIRQLLRGRDGRRGDVMGRSLPAVRISTRALIPFRRRDTSSRQGAIHAMAG